MAKATAVEQPVKHKRLFHVRFRLTKKWVVFLAVLFVITALADCGFMVAHNLTGPAVGTIIKSVPTKGDQTKPALAQFDGKNFSFIHPLTYVEQTTKQNPGDIEDHAFLSTGMTSEYLTIVITPLPTGNLSDNSAYLMRTQSPDKYQRKLVTVGNEQVTIFTANDGQQLQQTAFWPHQGKLLTMALTGVATDVPTAQSEFLSMVESLTWH